MNIYIAKQKQTHRYRKQTGGYQRGEGRGEQTRGMGLRDANYYIKEVSSKNIFHSTGNYSLYFAITFLFWLCVGFLSSCGEWGLLFSCSVEASQFSCCRAWALECASFSSLWHISLVALQHVESSRTRNLTHEPCTGRQIPNHWVNREVL